MGINYIELINKHKQMSYCLEYCISKIPVSWNFSKWNILANSVIKTIKSLTLIWNWMRWSHLFHLYLCTSESARDFTTVRNHNLSKAVVGFKINTQYSILICISMHTYLYITTAFLLNSVFCNVSVSSYNCRHLYSLSWQWNFCISTYFKPSSMSDNY